MVPTGIGLHEYISRYETSAPSGSRSGASNAVPPELFDLQRPSGRVLGGCVKPYVTVESIGLKSHGESPTYVRELVPYVSVWICAFSILYSCVRTFE